MLLSAPSLGAIALTTTWDNSCFDVDQLTGRALGITGVIVAHLLPSAPTGGRFVYPWRVYQAVNSRNARRPDPPVVLDADGSRDQPVGRVDEALRLIIGFDPAGMMARR